MKYIREYYNYSNPTKAIISDILDDAELNFEVHCWDDLSRNIRISFGKYLIKIRQTDEEFHIPAISRELIAWRHHPVVRRIAQMTELVLDDVYSGGEFICIRFYDPAFLSDNTRALNMRGRQNKGIITESTRDMDLNIASNQLSDILEDAELEFKLFISRTGSITISMKPEENTFVNVFKKSLKDLKMSGSRRPTPDILNNPIIVRIRKLTGLRIYEFSMLRNLILKFRID